MISLIDEPLLPFALIAALLGVRLAASALERLDARHTDAPELPKEPAEVTAPELMTPPAEVLVPPAPASSAAEEVSVPVALPLPQAEEEPPKSRFLFELLDSAMIAVVLVFFLVRPLFMQAFYIPSTSMVPTLQVGDKLLASKIIYRLREPREGDVVVFKAPAVALHLLGQQVDERHPVEYVKRAIGLPGDHVQIIKGQGIKINGQWLQEPYLEGLKPDYNFPPRENNLDPDSSVDPDVYAALTPNIVHGELIVPAKHLFVLGDNRSASHDSHRWGLLDRKNLIGKAEVIFLPFNRAGVIH